MPDSCQNLFFRIIGFENFRNRGKVFSYHIRIHGKRKRSKFHRFFPIINNTWGKDLFAKVRFQSHKLAVQAALLHRGKRCRGRICINAGPKADFVGKKGTDAGNCTINGLSDICGLCKKCFLHPLRCNGGNRNFPLIWRERIGSSGENLTNRANLIGDMLYAVDNHIRIIDKYNIAVLAHYFNDKFFAAEVAQFVEMLDFNPDNPLHPRLAD